jgi:hypothetical protein
VVDAPIEAHIPAVVGTEALGGSRRHVTDGVGAAPVDGPDRRDVHGVFVAGDATVLVEADHEDARAPRRRALADAHVDAAGGRPSAIRALELVLPALVRLRLPPVLARGRVAGVSQRLRHRREDECEPAEAQELGGPAFGIRPCRMLVPGRSITTSCLRSA